VLAGPPAAKARIVVDVVGPVGPGLALEHRPQHSVRARKRAHRRDQLVAHPGHQEAAKPACSVGDAQRGVTGAGQFPGGVDQLLQHLVHRQVGRYAEHGVAHRLQRRIQPLLRHLDVKIDR
jgi:hypothetical protein